MSKPTPGKTADKQSQPAEDDASQAQTHGEVRVIAQSKTHRVREDDLRRWKEVL